MQKIIHTQIQNLPVKKILIVGFPGSGKSTLALELASNFKLEYIEADKYFWKAHGEQVSEKEFLKSIEDKLAQTSEWIFEGHFKTCHSIVLKEATLVIEIKKWFWSSFWDYSKRELKRNDVLWRHKISKLLFVPMNTVRIQNTRKEALANYKGPVITI